MTAADWRSFSVSSEFVLLIFRVKVHTNKQMPRDVPALQLQTLAQRNGLFAQRERALKLTALAQGGGQLTDGFSGSLGAARVLTCNYEPFIGHNVNYTATQYSAHNKEALNLNPLNKTLQWAGATRECNGSTSLLHVALWAKKTPVFFISSV